MKSIGRRRLEVIFFLLAILLYLPGVWWGLPQNALRDRMAPWGNDEIGSTALSEIHTAVTRIGRYNPKYPLFGYVVQATAVAPYVLFSGRVWEPGTPNPGRVLRMEIVLARLTSVLLAAALVVVAMRTASVLFSPAHAGMAGALTLLLFPMFYYARTSNVDLPALFFTGVALLQYAICLRRGLTLTTAALLGGSAALAIATKDASYGALVPAGAVVAFLYWRTERRLVLIAAGIAIPLYVIASGLLLNWDRYVYHVHFVLTGSTRHYGFYYGSTRSYLAVLIDTVGFLIEAMSVPLALLAAIGFLLSVRRDRILLWWVVPPAGIVALTILPARFVVYRFVFGAAYCLVFFACVTLTSLLRRRILLGWIAIALVCGWSLLRDADLTWQMIHDSRYEAGAWLERNARPGDRLGYYGPEPEKLPFLNRDVTAVPGPRMLPNPDAAEFLIVEPWQGYESVHEYDLSEDTYVALRSGTAGYRQMLGLKTPALFPSRPGSFVNPEIKIFVRTDRLAALADRTPRIETRR